MSLPAIAVVGATGTAGEQVLAELAGTPAAAGVTAWASRACKVDSVDVGGRTVPVRPVGELGDARMDLAILCLPAEVGVKVAAGLLRRGTFVVDVGDSLAGTVDAPLALPGLSLPSVDAAAAAGALRLPTVPGWLLARVLAPLVELGGEGLSGVVNLPASAWGRDATGELSEQVVASFNLKDPPRVRFPHGLAFDTLVEDAPAGEWSERELLAAAEVAELTGSRAERVAVMLATQPLFAGVSAALHVRGALEPGAVEAALGGTEGLALANPASLRPRRLIGRSVLAVGGMRPDPGGDGVHLWAVADGARALGAAAAQVATWLIDHGVVTGNQA
jgi:aspartate-semialdehyde dehydrogenase